LNINKDGKTLYFSDEEIDNNTEGEKKVFVTKRINGKESHVKTQKKSTKENNLNNRIKKDENTFSFRDEIVLGINYEEDEEEIKESKKSNKNKKKNNNKNNKKIKKEEPKEKNKKATKHKKNKKSKTKKKLNKVLVTIITAIVLLIIIAIFALTAPIFNITEIDVEGNQNIAEATIINLSGLKKGENIFRFNKSVISKIKENPYIENVQISRNLPGDIIITVEEREIKYQINLINGYTYIDKSGYILENSAEKKDVPVLVGLSVTEDQLLNDKRLEIEDLEKLNQISKIIESAKTINIDKLITEINIDEDYVLYLESESKKIYIGDTTNLTNKMLYIQKILENEQGKQGSVFVNGDISAGFKPYFREE
jgi:cell division protein FtsQ